MILCNQSWCASKVLEIWLFFLISLNLPSMLLSKDSFSDMHEQCKWLEIRGDFCLCICEWEFNSAIYRELILGGWNGTEMGCVGFWWTLWLLPCVCLLSSSSWDLSRWWMRLGPLWEWVHPTPVHAQGAAMAGDSQEKEAEGKCKSIQKNFAEIIFLYLPSFLPEILKLFLSFQVKTHLLQIPTRISLQQDKHSAAPLIGVLQHKQTQTQWFLQWILPLLGSGVSVLQSSWSLHPNNSFRMTGSHMYFLYSREIRGGRGRNTNDQLDNGPGGSLCVGVAKWETKQKKPWLCSHANHKTLGLVYFSLTRCQVGSEWVWWGCPQ